MKNNDLDKLKEIMERYETVGDQLVYVTYLKRGFKNVFIADFDTVKLKQDKKGNSPTQNTHVCVEVLKLFYNNVKYEKREGVVLVASTIRFFQEFKKHNINISGGGKYHFTLVKTGKTAFRVDNPILMNLANGGEMVWL